MDLIDDFRRLFVDRDDCYAVQLESGGYTRIGETLTDEVLKRHLSGEVTVGGYQLNSENLVKYLCFDLDPEHLKDPKSTAEKILEAILNKIKLHYDSLLLEASRYPDPSYHIWIFFLPRFAAKAARWIGYRILQFSELNPKSIEVFPKQEELTEDLPYGNFVKLPLGRHQVAGKWSKFLDFHTFEPIPNDIIGDISGLSFSEQDTERIMDSGEKRLQVKLEIPKNFKRLASKEEERALQFLCKYWKPGYRNQLELSFLGWAIKKGISYDSAYRIIEEVADRTDDAEKISRLNLVDYHYKKRMTVPLKGKSGLREIVEEILKNEHSRRT